MVTINDPIYSNTQRKTMHSFPSSVRDVLFVEMHYITRVLVHDNCLQVISNRLLISLHPHGFICSSITSQLFKSPSLGSLINTMPADAWTRPKRGSEKAKNHGFMDTYFPSNGGSSKCKKCGYSLSKCCCKSTTDGKSSKPSSSNSSSRSWVELTHDLHVLFCFRQGLPPPDQVAEILLEASKLVGIEFCFLFFYANSSKYFRVRGILFPFVHFGFIFMQYHLYT